MQQFRQLMIGLDKFSGERDSTTESNHQLSSALVRLDDVQTRLLSVHCCVIHGPLHSQHAQSACCEEIILKHFRRQSADTNAADFGALAMAGAGVRTGETVSRECETGLSLLPSTSASAPAPAPGPLSNPTVLTNSSGTFPNALVFADLCT